MFIELHLESESETGRARFIPHLIAVSSIAAIRHEDTKTFISFVSDPEGFVCVSEHYAHIREAVNVVNG